MNLFAIDPGNQQSGYCHATADKTEVQALTAYGKGPNEAILQRMAEMAHPPDLMAIEMVAHYGQGMAAGATTFDTCVWIGRFIQAAAHLWGMALGQSLHLIYRREEKVNLLGSAKGTDRDIKVALADRFAPGQPRYGVGTKAAPGFFYGMTKDAWQATAVLVTAYDKYIRGIQI